MQVYLAVRNSNGDTIIVKKQEFNAWWKGRVQRRGIVNQAGQWALPGGGQEDGEDYVQAALREFKEETGVDLDDYLDDAEVAHGSVNYVLVALELGDKEVKEICNQVNANVAVSSGNGNNPTCNKIVDWELASAKLCSKAELKNHLGKLQDVPDPAKQEMGKDPLRHAIDWYARIAVYLYEN